jgi:integrase
MDLSRKRERDRLAVRPDPYWQALRKGESLGFRRGPDTWHVRLIRPNQPFQRQPLGEGIDYDEARRRAEEWLVQMKGTAARRLVRDSVKAGLQTYLTDLRRHGRQKAAEDAEWRFTKYVYNDPLADLSLEGATRDDFEEWRQRQLPGREPRTVNRQFRSVKAALNRAVELGHVGNPVAWKLKPLSDDVEDGGETAVFLTREQRHALILATEPAAGDFLHGLELSGARPHELANAVASDFDGASIRLAHHKGKPPKLRVRYTTLGEDGIAFFSKMAQGKPPDAPLFEPDDDRVWTTHLWSRRVRAAIEAHNNRAENEAVKLPVKASAYSFRHARISELLQLYNVDPITVAAQTGTSVAMIEKVYFKFIPFAMPAKLAAIKEVPLR